MDGQLPSHVDQMVQNGGEPLSTLPLFTLGYSSGVQMLYVRLLPIAGYLVGELSPELLVVRKVRVPSSTSTTPIQNVEGQECPSEPQQACRTHAPPAGTDATSHCCRSGLVKMGNLEYLVSVYVCTRMLKGM